MGDPEAVKTCPLCLRAIGPFLASRALTRALGTLPRVRVGLEASAQPKTRTPGGHQGPEPAPAGLFPGPLRLYTQTLQAFVLVLTVTVFFIRVKHLVFITHFGSSSLFQQSLAQVVRKLALPLPRSFHLPLCSVHLGKKQNSRIIRVVQLTGLNRVFFKC